MSVPIICDSGVDGDGATGVGADAVGAVDGGDCVDTMATDGAGVVTVVRGAMFDAGAGGAVVRAAVCLGVGAGVDAGVGAAVDTDCNAAVMAGLIVGEAAGGAGVKAVVVTGVGTAIDGGVKAASAAVDDLSVGASMYDAGSAETNKIAPESSGGAGVEVVVGTDVPAALGAGVGAGVGAACGSGVCGAVVVDVGANVCEECSLCPSAAAETEDRPVHRK